MADSSVVEIVAKAIWETQRKQEIAQLGELDIDTSYLPKAANLMVGSNRRTQVIVGFSAISKSLAIGMRTHLKHSTERDRREMLEGLGPLATDAAKLRLARLLGWMPKVVDGGIAALRQARNLVAHDIIGEEEIQFPSNLPEETRAHLDETIERMIKAARDHPESKGHVRRADHDTGVYALLLSIEALSAIMWGPSRLRLGMSSERLSSVSRFDESPNWYADSHRNMAQALLTLTKPDDESTKEGYRIRVD